MADQEILGELRKKDGSLTPVPLRIVQDEKGEWFWEVVGEPLSLENGDTLIFFTSPTLIDD